MCQKSTQNLSPEKKKKKKKIVSNTSFKTSKCEFGSFPICDSWARLTPAPPWAWVGSQAEG